MKLVLLLLVVLLAAWWTFGRRRPAERDEPRPGAAQPGPAAPPEPQAMLACAHCGVHLPGADAELDAQGRPFCSEAHRLAGPR